jgi:hypothetical protein
MLRVRKLLLAAVLMVGTIFGASSPALATTDASITGGYADSAARSILATWVPWDGNQITSAANCESRRQFIARTYRIKLSNLRCDRIDIGLPPCSLYRWILMINSDGVPGDMIPAYRPIAPAANPLC